MDQPAYTRPDALYLEKRALKRHARVLDLWALGVGAVISGDFFGWNFGLITSGFGGLLAALAVMTLLVHRPVLQHRRNVARAPAHRRRVLVRAHRHGALGRLCHRARREHGIHSDTRGHRGRRGRIPGRDFSDSAGVGAAVVARLLRRVRRAERRRSRNVVSRVGGVTMCALAILAVFYIGAAPRFDLHRWALDSGPWLPKGWQGILAALPFALWVYLGIEQLPLAAEESHDPARDMPRGFLFGLVTLIFCLISHRDSQLGRCSRRGQNRRIHRTAVPRIPDHLRRRRTRRRLLALFACTGLLASFHTIIYAYGRQIYSLSRAGYFPSWLSVTHGTPQDSSSRAAGRIGSGLRCGSGHSTGGPVQHGRRDPAEHGRFRRGPRIHSADGCRSFCCGGNFPPSRGPT